MRKFRVIVLLILLSSCSGGVPKGILTPKEFTPVLLDIHLAEGIYAQKYTLKITRESFQDDLYLSILKKHKVNQKSFEESLLYYGKHPDKYKLIYDDVLDKLNEMQAMSRAKDSIQHKK